MVSVSQVTKTLNMLGVGSAVTAQQRYEAGDRQPFFVERRASPGDPDQLLGVRAAQRHQEAATVGQLLQERLRDAGSRCRDEDRVVRGVRAPSQRPIPP